MPNDEGDRVDGFSRWQRARAEQTPPGGTDGIAFPRVPMPPDQTPPGARSRVRNGTTASSGVRQIRIPNARTGAQTILYGKIFPGFRITFGSMRRTRL